MNCNNCGAPMTPVDGRNYLSCGFCHTFHFPTELENSADRITPLVQQGNLACPVCEQDLEVGALDGVHAMFCRQCRGLLIPNEHFAQVVTGRRREYSGREQTPVPIDPTQYERLLDCARCGGRMEVHPYHGPGNVVVDSCAACHLLWLDHGELAAIERAPGQRRPTPPPAPAPLPPTSVETRGDVAMNLFDLLFD